MREVHTVSRRAVLQTLGGVALGLTTVGVPFPREAGAAGGAMSPEESVDATLQRLFGGRQIQDGSATMKLDVPLIAENGAVVPVTVEAVSPMSPEDHVKHIYIIADKNLRPLTARFSFTPASGRALVGTNVRLGTSTDVRAIAEKNDGTLYVVKQAVKVTRGGCGG